MPDLANEPKYDTTTARVFYRLRDLFIQKGSAYTAKSLKLAPVGVGLLVALGLIGAVLYRLSEPMGKGRPPAPALTVSPPEAAKIRREAPPEQKPHWPSNEEILRRLTGQLAPAPSEPASPDSRPSGEPTNGHPGEPLYGTPSAGLPPGTSSGAPASERPRGEEPLESSKVFERPLSEEKSAKENPDYEYISRIAAAAPVPAPENAKPGGAETVHRRESLYQEVRARLLTRIDTSLPGSLVVAEAAREYELAGFPVHRGDLLLGQVSAAGPKRVSILFNRLIDRDRREHAVDAQAVDLAGATGLPAKPADSRFKKGLLYANDRALDYVRAFKGHVTVYSNPAQSDVRALENKAVIVEPNAEFYVIFQRIHATEARP